MSHPLVLFSSITVVLFNLSVVNADDNTTQVADSSSPPAHEWPSMVTALTVIAVIVVSIFVLALVLHQKPFGERGIQPRLPRLLLGPNLSNDDFNAAFGLGARNSTDSGGRGSQSRDRLIYTH